MDELLINKILYNLKEFNEELNIPREKVVALNAYNEQFINSVFLHDNVLHDDEVEYYTKLKSILDVIEQKKRTSNALLEKEMRKNDLLFDERFNVSKEIYDNEIRTITKGMDELSSSFEKSISSITNASYYKNLDIIQTNKQYDIYLKNIKDNYLEKINYFFLLQEDEIFSIDSEEKASYIELENTLEKINDIFNSEVEVIKKEKLENYAEIQKEKFNKEKILLNQKIELNKKLDVVSNEFKEKITKLVIPYKSHVEYLTEQIQILSNAVKEKEIEILDEFKLSLEDIDKELELHKQDTNEEKEDLTLKNVFNLPKRLSELDNKNLLFNEQMRTEKLNLDTIKSFKVKKIYLEFESKKNILNKKIELTNFKIKNLETISSFEEYLDLIKIRHETDLEEMAIKNELDNIKQANYLLEDNDRANIEYYNTIHEYQLKLHKDATDYNSMLYQKMKDNIRTLKTLDIEKNLILKNYNIELNNLLRLKLECSSSLIKADEEFEINKQRSLTELNKKTLSQDIQLANKQNSLQKKLITLEKEFFEHNIINAERSKLEDQIYRIFEDRFAIERKLYELYLNDLIQVIDIFNSYLIKYNTLTRCSNKNIALTTFDYLLGYLKDALQKSIDKIIKVTTDRINFEGTINFQYELNKLISEREQIDTAFNTSNSKMEETIENYKKTIILYNKKIKKVEGEIYKSENTLILRNMELARTDSKNTTSIDKVNLDILILKEAIVNYRKEQKNYNEAILKNNKSIVDLEKSINKNVKKYNKNSANIDNQLETIEKRHKLESSVYYKFIDKVNALAKTFDTPVEKNEIEESIYKYYKKYTSTITTNINEFKINYMDTLINSLYNRHEVLLANSVVKSEERKYEIKELYDLQNKTACATYNDEISEIEKRIEKLHLINDTNLKENVINHKEKCSIIKNKAKNIEINITRNKAQLLYDIDTFAENINYHNNLNLTSISQFKSNRKGLSKEYYKHSEELTEERHTRKLSIDIIHNNAVESLKISYKNLVKDKITNYKKKDSAYHNQITECKIELNNKLLEFDAFISTNKIELTIANVNLDKALENSLHLIKKRSQSKINKENKKFNKKINN
ncbi:MAG: hypothetical protein R3Y05_01865 [bacterium]